jgi:hypothetical protein
VQKRIYFELSAFYIVSMKCPDCPKEKLMHIDVRSTNVRLPRAHAIGLTERIREMFARLAHRISRIVVRMGDATQRGAAARECTVEVHLPTGEVMVVKERQRKLGALLRRVTDRAWKAAAAAMAGKPEVQQRRQLRLSRSTRADMA